MTTYSHTLSLTPSETLAFIDVVEAMLKLCEDKIANGPCAPYWAHADSCRRMLENLKSGEQGEGRELVIGDSAYAALEAAVKAFNIRLYEKLISSTLRMMSTNSFYVSKD